MERDWAILQIDEARMWVSLAIKEPLGDEATSFSPAFIEQYLKDNGIKSGILKEAIEALSAKVQYGQAVIVAKGKEPINGRDGIYKYTVPLEDAKSKPAVNEDGSVDYFNSLKLAMVNAGDLIAVYEPATPGEYGFTVFAEMLPPVKGREQRPLRGKGIVVSEDGLRYTAEYDGRIYKDDEKIVVDKIYVVKGDLDLEKGNIHFNGDVEVKGDVRSGLTIETTGNIFVNGHVGGCTLIAGENITIKKGVQGRKKCFIKAGGEVAVSFVERCKIEAKGNVYADSILDSEVVSNQEVIVSSKKGVIIGGSVSATQGIKAKETGNDAGTVTILQTGVVVEAMKRVAALVEQHHKCKTEIEFLDKNLKLYDSLEGEKRTKETEAVRMKILRAKVIKNTEAKQISDEMNDLNRQIEQAKSGANVRITGIVNVGTRINIGREWFGVKEVYKDVKFVQRLDKVCMLAGDDGEELIVNNVK